MGEQIATSVNGVPIRLTDERWRHIQAAHPEVETIDQILEAIQNPDIVQQAAAGALLAARREDALYLVVVYREVTPSSGFIITAYKARRLGRGRTLWRR